MMLTLPSALPFSALHVTVFFFSSILFLCCILVVFRYVYEYMTEYNTLLLLVMTACVSCTCVQVYICSTMVECTEVRDYCQMSSSIALHLTFQLRVSQ